MVSTPLFIEIGRGAIERLGELLADQRISSTGQVAVAVGPGQGERVVSDLGPRLSRAADVVTVSGGSLDAATGLESRLRTGSYDAVVGIGGGRTLDVTKYAATRLGLPMVAVATNLAHDGIASPVSSLLNGHGKGSYGVSAPMAVVVDLDYVRSSPPRMVRSGVGDVVSNLSAVADWELAGRERGEPVDRIATTFSRAAAEAVLHRPDDIESDDFLTVLAEALVLSGLAMTAAGTSRPCSGGDHEVLHAVETLFPGVSNHGELAGLGALLMAHLRGGGQHLDEMLDCLRRHRLPCTPQEAGLSEEELVQAVLLAPSTRPDRYTVIEHLALDEDQTRKAVAGFVAAVDR